MNMGILGMRGHEAQWSSMIEAAHATKNHAALKSAMAKPNQTTRASSKRQTTSEKNRATMSALMTPPNKQTTSQKNIERLVGLMK